MYIIYCKWFIYYIYDVFQTIEEHKTVIDNDGKKTTKVRRIIGDSSHEVITKSDNEGIKEKEENFINMDESMFFPILSP